MVGAGCRLPGGIDTLDKLWSALIEERDLVAEAPADRFDRESFYSPDPRRSGKSYTFAGGFLEDIASWDAEYFGVSPREAARLDPQHRLLLEMAVDAIDDAGIDPATLAGTDTGVYVGLFERGYGGLQTRDLASVDTTTMLGTLGTAAPNRVSYFLDLRGPSVMVDTACSSALVAVHLACESLQLGRSRLALAGAVNALVNPHEYVLACKAGALGIGGRSRAFSAEADGYARAEGGGVLVLKRLADALADDDRVYAVILGSRTNCDGRTRGLAHPGVDAQAALLREVYERAGVEANDLTYFEAHGTGTPAGDPVECEAIGRALGRPRTGAPLPIGSVKTNIGHLEAAAGIAGILKGILMIRHGRIAPSLHAEHLNPAIDFEGLGLAPARTVQPMPDGRRIVGVNSFGMGGANAHVIIAAPDTAVRAGTSAGPIGGGSGLLPYVVSARSDVAAREAARRGADRLAGASPDEFYDLAYTACRRRGQHGYRAAVLADSPVSAAEQLRAAEPVSAVRSGKTAFVFSGNGSQWHGMGAALLRESIVFAAAIEEIDGICEPLLGWSITTELRASAERSRLSLTEVAQPLLFAVQVGSVRMLDELGVRPSAVVGHSVGEVAAAYTAGVFDLATACRVIAERSAAQAITAGRGRMAAAGLGFAEAERVLADYREHLEIAGVNSESDVTLAGAPWALEEVGAELARRDVFFRMLGLDYAFHSAAMDPIEPILRGRLAGLRAVDPVIPMLSTVTAGPLRGTEADAAYWWRNVREPVLFAPAIDALAAQEFDVFVEIGPHPVLGGYLRKLGADRPTAIVPTMTRSDDSPSRIRTAAATVIAAGGAVDWNRWFPRPGAVANLPAYPWQRERHWHGEPQWWSRRVGDGRDEHPLLGERADLAQPTWRLDVEPHRLPWLADHRVDSAVVMPAAAYVEMAVAAGNTVLDAPVELVGFGDLRALTLPWDDPAMDVRTQASVNEDDGAVVVASRSGAGNWQVNARGVVRSLVDAPPAPVKPDALADENRWEHEEFYTAMQAVGLVYGPAFRVLRTLRIGDGELVAEYDAPYPDADFVAHPMVLDAALQAVMPLLANDRLYLPSGFDAVKVWRRPAAAGLIVVRLTDPASLQPAADITIADVDGTVSIAMTGVRLRFQRSVTVPLQHDVTVLRAAPRIGERTGGYPLPGCGSLVAAAAERLGDAATRDRRAYADQLARTGVFHAHLAARTLAEFVPGDVEFTAADIIAAGADAKYAAMVDVLIALAHDGGLLERVGDGAGERWRVHGTAAPDALFRALVADFPEVTTVPLVFGRVAARIPEVLRGELDAVELIFSEADAHFVERTYSTGPANVDNLRRATAVVRELVERWPADRPLRILEVGGGTGMVTSQLLPLLPADRTRYVFTDVSQWFLPKAETRFQDYDFVEYRLLDLDRSPLEQGFAAGEFDVVVGGYVLHAAADVRAALRGVGELLADGGDLIAVEIHDTATAAVCFGVLESFWGFTDSELRTRSPLLAVPQWEKVLADSGFTEVAVFGDGLDPVLNSVLVARHPGSEAIGDPLAVGGPVAAADWLVAAEPADASLADELCERLPGGGTRIPLAADDSDWSAALAGTGGDDGPNIVLLLGGSEMSGDVDATLGRAAVLRAIATAVIRGGYSPNLWLVTRPSGMFGAPEAAEHPVDAAVWAMTRVLVTEQPGITLRAVSLDRTRRPLDRLMAELLDPGEEDEIVLTAHGRFVPRHRRLPRSTVPGTDVARYALRVANPGPSYRISWTEMPDVRPGPGEVVIEVAAVALNNRDVMQALGRTEPQPGVDDHPVCFDCAGVVCEVGEGVTTVRPGDRVFAITLGAGASRVVTRADLVGLIPDGMTFTQAATLPVVSVTVHRALHDLARLEPGETVLIHAATSGVGLAALHYAQRIGATVVATAGTPVKRDLLRMLGVDHVFDSRDLRFADRIRAAVGQVDVVLNSLTGEAVTRSMELLRPAGRFIELGPIDPQLHAGGSAVAVPRSLLVAAVDIHDQSVNRHENDACLPEVVEAVRTGMYRPLPHSVYPADRAVEAFRALQHSQHVGKIVISLDPPPSSVGKRASVPAFDPEAAYVVTGGTSGLGAESARWLVDHGARTLALVGRRGAATPGAAQLLAELDARGARATAHAVDVTDARQVRTLLSTLESDGHPVRGIIHAAALFDDSPTVEYTDDRLRAVLAAKMDGARILDELTRDRQLDFFVNFSSFVHTVANRNQSGYVAANAYEEAVVHARRQAGLPGLAVLWGAISDFGHVARNDLSDSLAGLGFGVCDAATSVAAMGGLLDSGAAVVTAQTPDWGRLAAMFPLVSRPRFAGMLSATPVRDGEERRLSQLIAQAPDEQAAESAQAAVAGLIARILQTTPDRVQPSRRLDELGVDSLMATEVTVAIRRQFDCDVPLLEVASSTVTDLARRLMLRMRESAGSTR
ncbi:SDR family NAD(P)-dependent oxidoreductase [Nocardia sp. ET3-3]|uniref:SDR family NAD(P)-dependent oxidoreductase n=1 Tax=Nocardia terrae TaxID=2675851 RepID=A0A7K1UV12_9NOCA|nr:SDR family NAD(P)-dependent oxidoreductase [Nocardia terrae]